MNLNQKITIQAPSNIAFIKYWGKFGRQYPINPSLSMTLKKCVTKSTFELNVNSERPEIKVYLAEKFQEDFSVRIQNFLRSLVDIHPDFKNLSGTIKSNNTFPHSAGIASSASSFACLGYFLALVERELNGEVVEPIEQRASFFARLGSGSAARSIHPGFNLWGNFEEIGNNDYSIVLQDDIHSEFNDLRDCILIVDSEKKKVSSSAGHALMHSHPYKAARIQQALDHTRKMLSALKNGDWELFGEVLENEALTLHGLMMNSSPSFLLLRPGSLEIIEKVRAFREESKLPLFFTIDAGPNIHLIYPGKDAPVIERFITEELSIFCEKAGLIFDRIGEGAKLI